MMSPGSAQKPPRLAVWILKRVLPIGKRGESIRGDLHEEFFRFSVPGSRFPSRSLWYWQQTVRLTLRYLVASSPQPTLAYPRSRSMWFELSSDVKTACRGLQRAPGTSALIVLTLAF